MATNCCRCVCVLGSICLCCTNAYSVHCVHGVMTYLEIREKVANRSVFCVLLDQYNAKVVTIVQKLISYARTHDESFVCGNFSVVDIVFIHVIVIRFARVSPPPLSLSFFCTHSAHILPASFTNFCFAVSRSTWNIQNIIHSLDIQSLRIS